MSSTMEWEQRRLGRRPTRLRVAMEQMAPGDSLPTHAYPTTRARNRLGNMVFRLNQKRGGPAWRVRTRGEELWIERDLQ